MYLPNEIFAIVDLSTAFSLTKQDFQFTTLLWRQRGNNLDMYERYKSFVVLLGNGGM